MIKCQLGVNVGSLTSKKTRRKCSSNEQILSGYWVGNGSLHAINTDCLFANQTDANAWQLPDYHFIRGCAAPRIAMIICVGINKRIDEIINHWIVILNQFVYWRYNLIKNWTHRPLPFPMYHYPVFWDPAILPTEPCLSLRILSKQPTGIRAGKKNTYLPTLILLFLSSHIPNIFGI